VLEEWQPSVMPVRRPLVDQVIASLRELIEQEGLGPGDRLPTEPRLTQRLGVGRSTVREAIRALSHGGLLETRQGSGTFVRAPTAQPPLDARLTEARVTEVFEVRRALEVLIAETAPQRRTDEHIQRMRAALQECRDHAASGDIRAFVAADSQFHQVAAEATGNSVLIELYAVLRRSLEHASVAIADLVELHHANERHAVLLQAIADAEPETAVAATRQHLEDTVKLFEAALQTAGDND
jgi:DNA-binding FadR family transcriptional regulator